MRRRRRGGDVRGSSNMHELTFMGGIGVGRSCELLQAVLKRETSKKRSSSYWGEVHEFENVAIFYLWHMKGAHRWELYLDRPFHFSPPSNAYHHSAHDSVFDTKWKSDDISHRMPKQVTHSTLAITSPAFL